MAQLKQSRKPIIEVEDNKKRMSFADLFVPIIAFIAFIILTIFVYIPQIEAAVAYNDDIQSLKKDASKMQSNINTLDALEGDETELLLDLASAQSVIPNKLAVSDFTFEVNDLAHDYNLNLQSISSSDINYIESEDVQYSTGVIKGITGPLRYEGQFSNIIDFLDKIKLKSPYLIETSEIQMRKYEGMDRWSLDLAVTGYYFVETSYKLNDYTMPITDYRNRAEFLQELRSRGENIDKASVDDAPADVAAEN